MVVAPVAMYTGCAPGVFVQDAEFLCAQAGSLLISASFLVIKLSDDFWRWRALSLSAAIPMQSGGLAQHWG